MNVLETHGLAVGFGGRGAGRTLVSGIEVSLAPGRTAALLGPNGAGKSTLLRTIAGLLPQNAGSVVLLGKSVDTYSPSELATRRAFMSSFRGEPLEMTVWESAALGRHPHTNWAGRMRIRDRQAVEAALESVGLLDFRDRRMADLSDGERQKATIARSLAQEPQLLILDEPTAFLDALRREELMALLRRLAEEKKWACVVTTHELDLALRFADHVWLLPLGGPLKVRKAAETTKADVMRIAFRA